MAVFCPEGGGACSLRSRRLRERPDCAGRRVAPRRRLETTAPSPRASRRVGSPLAPARWHRRPSGRSFAPKAVPDPHAPVQWLLLPAGRISPPPPRCRLKRSRGPATEPPGPGFNVSSRRVGVSNRQAGASGHASLGRGNPARGPGRGVGDPAKRETPRGPGTGRAAGSRPRESRSAASPACGGTSKQRGAAHPLGNTKHSRSSRKGTGSEPAGQKTTTEWKKDVSLARHCGRDRSGVRLSPWCRLAGQLLGVRPSGDRPAQAGPGRAGVPVCPCALGGDV